jgi:hypothetical protein
MVAARRPASFGNSSPPSSLVVDAERQALRGLDLGRQRRIEADVLVGNQVGRHGDDDLVGGQRAARGHDPHALAGMVDQRHLRVQRDRTRRAIGRDQRAVTAPDAPVDAGVLI